MSYGQDLGNKNSILNAGISEDPTNPSQMGYSINRPLARVRKQSLDNTIASVALNYPSANKDNCSVATLGNITDTATQFANDLTTETSQFVTGQVVAGVPNYYLIGGIVLGGILLNKLVINRKPTRRRRR